MFHQTNLVIKEKNRLIIALSFLTMLSSLMIHFLHRMFNIHRIDHSHISGKFDLILNVILLTPLALFLFTFWLYRKKGDHRWIPLFNTLILTFSSISMIAGGNGMVEYHFSIFMVIAMISYYENITLTVVMTVLFTLQHLGGYFFVPELVYGSSTYAFSMVLIHAVFLLATSGASIWVIVNKKKVTEELQKEKEQKQTFKNQMIQSLTLTSRQVATTSNQLFTHSKESKNLSTNIKSAILEIKNGSDTQVQAATEAARAIEEMAIGIQHITETSSRVAEVSQEAAKEAERGNSSIQNAIAQIETIHALTHDFASIVTMLDERSKEIEQIVKIITDLASKTNLLSLNAAIEAAKAGEHGRGFAVVASEVRKLAEQSAQSAYQISDLIKSVQADTTLAVKAMNKVNKEVEIGITKSKEAIEAFNRILYATQQVAEQNQDLSAVLEEMAAGSEEITATLEDMLKIIKEFSTNIQQVASASNEQWNTANKVTLSAESLNKLSQELEEVIRNIKI
ncbi:MAG: hypothetical protein BAA01_04035 [Bacillus thermozeamaize]|uniref:Methyl-accepting transducer domain-containing protein n=1 Tax=Bacillus thermozeamaize TaxID=230954 RepID=A0A1Y3PNR8_9BACI|nr:MAG: hypothetical protein BAA01_04035 [Bacillus thermozeamaize]